MQIPKKRIRTKRPKLVLVQEEAGKEGEKRRRNRTRLIGRIWIRAQTLERRISGAGRGMRVRLKRAEDGGRLCGIGAARINLRFEVIS
jgi:hypothetical protein